VSSATPNRVPVEERLFSLVLALLATESGLTKSEILSSVQGYRQRYDPAGGNASLERQFERDKDDIRELGVPLETVEDPSDAGNNQALRYRIPKGSYDLPPDIAFSPEEMTLLGLAATVWREGSLSAESRRAIMKLRSLGVESDGTVLGYAPRLRARDSAFEPLSIALEKHNIVTFEYLKPGEASARTRTVAPLALVQHQGRWHLTGIDQDAHGSRTFLLSRIVGSVRTTPKTFTPEGSDFAVHALDELDRVWNSNTAHLTVAPNSDAAARLSKQPGAEFDGDTMMLHYSDVNILADQLAGFGPEVVVIDPPDLRERVIDRLRSTLAAHLDEQHDEPDPIDEAEVSGA
jgi:proteasome accessory factor B